jgi:predicted DNA-binding transcriptional regulator YafY
MSSDMKRFDRVTAILIHLQSRKIVKAQEIADRFDVSLRTVYRDIRTLERAGIPIISEPGVGYSIVEGYRLPPVLFTKEEAASLLTAEKLIQNLADTKTSGHNKSAMYKIRSVLHSSEKDLLEKIDGHLEVVRAKHQTYKTERLQSLQEILLAVSAQKVLFIHYFTHYKQQKTERYIEPIGIFYSGNNWHLIAHYIEEEKYFHGFAGETEAGEYVEMTFLTQWIEGFTRWYLSLADHACIVQPEKLKKRAKSLISDISSRL